MFAYMAKVVCLGSIHRRRTDMNLIGRNEGVIRGTVASYVLNEFCYNSYVT